MAVAEVKAGRGSRLLRARVVRRDLPWRKRLVYMSAIYVAVFSLCFVLGEIGFRLFWSPKYWIHTGGLLVGSGQTEAGKKWWPETKYLVESNEFRTEFRTNAQGYRARPGPRPLSPYRIAFVGDSFTEGMQVAYESTFCARLETMLASPGEPRALVCENFGVSATDLLEYWHRIHHDVLAKNPPDAVVLCVYPGNDFQTTPPEDAFDREGKPLASYYHAANWSQHVIAWLNLHSKLGCYAQRALLSARGTPAGASNKGPKNWWSDPAVAARAASEPAVRRSRATRNAGSAERSCASWWWGRSPITPP
jgi:hypothetical protein